MTNATSLKRVIVVPRNGYLNRLQALASSSVLADTLRVPLYLTWEPEEDWPAMAESLFVPQDSGCSIIPSDDLTRLLGRRHQDMPRYVTVDQGQDVLFLAGHDRGEQVFMSQVSHLLSTTTSIENLVIVAGGKFHLPGEGDFLSKRRGFYSKISWQADVRRRVDELTTQRDPYLGLHIRQTDRSREAPTPRAIQRSLVEMSSVSSIRDVFVAADTPAGLKEWRQRISSLGLHLWTSDAMNFDRSKEDSARDALIDWCVLGKAQAIVYSAISSFGQEAAIMTAHPEWSRGLQASMPMRYLRDSRRLATSAKRRVYRAL